MNTKTMEHLVEIFAAFAGGAGVHAIVNHLTRRKSDNEELNDTAVRLLRDEIDILRGKLNLMEQYNAQHTQKIGALEKQNYELKMRNDILQIFPFTLPLPVWSVNQGHCYDFINDMYAKVFLSQFGMNADDAMGKNLFEVWPKEIADTFVANNKKVMEEDLIMNDLENVPNALGQPVKWRIIKIKRPYPVGVFGIAIPKNGMFDKMLRKIKDQ